MFVVHWEYNKMKLLELTLKWEINIRSIGLIAIACDVRIHNRRI